MKMKQYVRNPKVNHRFYDESEPINYNKFLEECEVPSVLEKILRKNSMEIYFGQYNDLYFYVLDGIPSFYR